jgi:hypothetical protein
MLWPSNEQLKHCTSNMVHEQQHRSISCNNLAANDNNPLSPTHQAKMSTIANLCYQISRRLPLNLAHHFNQLSMTVATIHSLNGRPSLHADAL